MWRTKIYSKILSLLIISCISFAGTDIGHGGGDPYAQGYVDLMKEVPDLIRKSDTLQKLISADEFEEMALEFEKSINDKDPYNDLVVFSSDPIYLEDPETGEKTPKPAKFEDGRAYVYRKAWRDFKLAGEKAEMRAITLLEGLLKKGVLINRYKITGEMMIIDPSDVFAFAETMNSSKMKVMQATCEKTKTFTGPNKNEEVTETKYDVMFNLSWKLRGKKYQLVKAVKDKRSHSKNKDLIGQHILTKKAGTTEGVVESERESIFYYLNNRKQIKRQTYTSYNKKTALGENRYEYQYKMGEKGKFYSSQNKQVEAKVNETAFIVSESKGVLAGKEQETPYVSKSTCFARKQPVEELIPQFTGFNKNILKRIRTAHEAAVEVNNLDIAFRLCQSESSFDFCQQIEESANKKEKALKKLWAGIYKMPKPKKRRAKKRKTRRRTGKNRSNYCWFCLDDETTAEIEREARRNQDRQIARKRLETIKYIQDNKDKIDEILRKKNW